MSERKEQLKTKLAATRQMLDQVFSELNDRWDQQVYSDGLGWNVRQIFNHLADAERGHYMQASNIADGKDIIPEDFDIERYNKRTTEKNAERSGDDAYNEIKKQREQLLTWLDALDDEKLDQMGRHASLQIMSVHDIVRLLALHERAHVQDMAKMLNIELK